MAEPPIFVDGQPATAAMLQALGSEVAFYVPSLTAATTDPVLGSGGSPQGMWVQVGPLAMVWWCIQFGTSGVNAGDGQYRVSLPVPIAAGGLAQVAVGSGRVRDNSVAGDLGSNIISCLMLSGDPSKIVLAVEEAVTVSESIPWTWAASDYLVGWCCYPAQF